MTAVDLLVEQKCTCGEETLAPGRESATVARTVHRRGRPCYEEAYALAVTSATGQTVEEFEDEADSVARGRVHVDVDPPVEPVRLTRWVWCIPKGLPHLSEWFGNAEGTVPCAGPHRHLYGRFVAEDGVDAHVEPQPDPYEDEKRASMAACTRDAERMLSHAHEQALTNPYAVREVLAQLLQQVRRYDGLETRLTASYNHQARRREIEHDEVCQERNAYRERLREIRNVMRGLKIPRL